jgi:medium-chain acyl-[acyl-carrier-protein] hydrolase
MRTSCLTHVEPRPDALLRLFCLPYAGGNAAAYRAWAHSLPETVELCPVEFPGHGTRLRERPVYSIHALAGQLAHELAPFLDKPFVVFGHSMGAITGFELARVLRDRYGRAPEHLVVSAHRAPHIPHPGPLTYSQPDDQFLDRIMRLGGTPKELQAQPELIALALPIMRADFTACDTYRYVAAPPLDCPITVYGGLRDPMVDRGHLGGWAEQSSRDCTLRIFPGEHFFINTARTLVLGNLGRVLDQSVGALAV